MSLKYTIGLLLALPLAAHAAEGMWTLDNLPLDALAREHGFKPDKAWLDKARLSSARLAGGCSGSFISPDGLVLTLTEADVKAQANAASGSAAPPPATAP